jgi:general secretion pathway protein H
MTRMWAPGSERVGRDAAASPIRSRGFTLIELLVVVAIVGMATALVTLAIRDPAATRLDQEGARLAALLEAARAESRVSGVAVVWTPLRNAGGASAEDADFRFVGLPKALGMPSRWLDRETTAEISGARSVVLGPEPIIGAQRVVLRLGDRRLTLATDGFAPFAAAGADAEEGR